MALAVDMDELMISLLFIMFNDTVDKRGLLKPVTCTRSGTRPPPSLSNPGLLASSRSGGGWLKGHQDVSLHA
jgi:hypothetical protein